MNAVIAGHRAHLKAQRAQTKEEFAAVAKQQHLRPSELRHLAMKAVVRAAEDNEWCPLDMEIIQRKFPISRLEMVPIFCEFSAFFDVLCAIVTPEQAHAVRDQWRLLKELRSRPSQTP